MVEIKLTLTPAEAERLHTLSWADDRGPVDEGWQSETAGSLGKKIRAALEAASAEQS